MKKDDKGNYVWKTKSGQEIVVGAMSRNHLKNTIHFLQDNKAKYSRNWYDNTIRILKKEYNLRKEEEKTAICELMDYKPVDKDFLETHFLEICKSSASVAKLMSKLPKGIPVEYLKKYGKQFKWDVFWNVARELNYSKEYMEEVLTQVQFNSKGILHFNFFDEEMCSDYIEVLNRGPIIASKKFQFSFWRKYVDIFNDIDWRTFSAHYAPDLTLEFIREHKSNICWDVFLKNKDVKLSENTVEELRKYLNWQLIASNWALKESFMIKFKDDLDWKLTTRHQYKRMTPEFIIEMRDYVDWDFLLKETNEWPASQYHRQIDKNLMRPIPKTPTKDLIENRMKIDWSYMLSSVWKIDPQKYHRRNDFY